MATEIVLAGKEELSSLAMPMGAEELLPEGGRTAKVAVLLGFRAPSLAFARRCHEAGIRVYLVEFVWPGAESRPGSATARPSSAIEEEQVDLPWPLVGTPEGFKTVCSVLERVQADLLITVDEYSQIWLAGCREDLPAGCVLLAASEETLARSVDKLQQIERARASGFRVLSTRGVETKADLSRVEDSLFPVCVRPSNINSIQPPLKADVFMTAAELRSRLANSEWTKPLVVQPFLYGPNYVLHGVRHRNGEMLALRLFKANRKCYGFAARLSAAELPDDLGDAARRYAEAEGIVGPFHFDLLQPEGREEFYFLEVNVRLGGTTAKVTRLGMDESLLTLKAFGLCGPVEPPKRKAWHCTTSVSLEVRRALDELRNRPDPLAYPRFSGIKGFFAAVVEAVWVRDAILSLRDIRGSIWYIFKGSR